MYNIYNFTDLVKFLNRPIESGIKVRQLSSMVSLLKRAIRINVKYQIEYPHQVKPMSDPMISGTGVQCVPERLRLPKRMMRV